MERLSHVDFGPVDAKQPDKHFLEKYVEEDNFKKLIDNEYNIITGEKGSGKTALIKGLTLKHKKKYTHIINVGFDDLSFSAIFNNLTIVANTSNIFSLSLIFSYWKYSLIIEAMKKVIGSRRTQFSPAEKRIFNYLVENKHIAEDLFSRLLNLCKRMWELIRTATSTKINKSQDDDYPGSIHPDILSEIKNFPLQNKKYKEVENTFAEYIKQKNLKILIALDGLDIIKLDTKEDLKQVTLIFEGLVAATYDISTSELFSEGLILKALIPYDIYLLLELRDQDKYEEKYTRIRWDYKSLQEFLRKRIVRSLDFDHSVNFDKAWSEILPKHVMNTHIGIMEDSYEYLLRHTLYRPRQFQVHLAMLSETYGDRIIKDHMIVEVVRESTRKLVGYLVAEQRIAHPRLDEFIHHLRGRSNIITYGKLQSIVGGIMRTMQIGYKPVQEKINVLYQIGFIGRKRDISIKSKVSGVFHRYQPPLKGDSEPYICDFFHNVPDLNFTHGLNDKDEIVIHPMFYDYCDIRPSQDFIIG